MTWLWTTRIEVINPAYSADGADDNSDISSMPVEIYRITSKDGYLAARVFAFVDVSIAVKHLKQLALVLAGAGLLGCALLIFVSRKIIDRASFPWRSPRSANASSSSRRRTSSRPHGVAVLEPRRAGGERG